MHSQKNQRQRHHRTCNYITSFMDGDNQRDMNSSHIDMESKSSKSSKGTHSIHTYGPSLSTRSSHNPCFQPCKYEPCLYYNPNYNGVEIYFLQQEDDFAISYANIDITNKIIVQIDSHMTIKVKSINIINRFKGIEVYQTYYYIKINNTTYIHNIISAKK